MPYLSWISDKDLQSEVSNLLVVAEKAMRESDKNFTRNVVDPFSAIFEMAGFKLDVNSWVRNEKLRQVQKTLQNQIGEFHQNVLGYADGWINKRVGNVIDLVSDKEKVIAEVKNKYNTVSGGKLGEVYYSLESKVNLKSSIYKDYTAYFVNVIPKSKARYNSPFTPSNKETGMKCPENNKIRIIDGASFYTLVTKDQRALNKLYFVLPEVIKDCSGGEISISLKDTLPFYKNAFGLD